MNGGEFLAWAALVFVSAIVLGMFGGDVSNIVSRRRVAKHDARCHGEGIWIGTVFSDCSCKRCRTRTKAYAVSSKDRERYERLKRHFDSLDDPNVSTHRIRMGGF